MIAKLHLEPEQKGANVQCRTVAIDRHRRPVATSTANGRDLSEIMVRSGWALDFTQDGLYFAAETEARQARRRIWIGTFEEPADWRARNPRRPARF
jgi:endonuclease YncB( thermonuclease family)